MSALLLMYEIAETVLGFSLVLTKHLTEISIKEEENGDGIKN
jgi:hypothetical protein